MEGLGEKLRARAQELGLADAEVARRIGLSQSRYANYVNGVREPDFTTFVKICRALGITPNEALGFETKLAPSAHDKLTSRISAATQAMTPETLATAAVVMDALVSNQASTPKK